MNEIIKKSVLISVAMIALVGTAWGGWFSFEPNILLLDGTCVARELADLQKELEYRKNGDIANADELIKDAKVLVINSQKHDNRGEFLKYKEKGDNIFVFVKDESGSKMWANMLTLVCLGADGTNRPVTKEDLIKGDLPTLSK